MAEEASVLDKKEETQEKAKVELSPIEVLAQRIGWNPEYDGENAVDAETFIINSKEIQSSLSKKVRTITKEMEAMREAVQVIAENSNAVRKAEVEGVQSKIEALNEERLAAVREGDVDKYTKIDKKIETLTKKVDEKAKQVAPPTKSSEYLEWVEENEWYDKDSEMRKWADIYATETAPAEVKALPRKKLLAHITKKAKELFPEKFEEPKKTVEPDDDAEPEPKKTSVKTVSHVAAPSRKAKTGNKKYGFDDLNYTQKKIAEQMVQQLKGTKLAMTLDEYADKILQKHEEEK